MASTWTALFINNPARSCEYSQMTGFLITEENGWFAHCFLLYQVVVVQMVGLTALYKNVESHESPIYGVCRYGVFKQLCKLQL